MLSFYLLHLSFVSCGVTLPHPVRSPNKQNKSANCVYDFVSVKSVDFTFIFEIWIKLINILKKNGVIEKQGDHNCNFYEFNESSENKKTKITTLLYRFYLKNNEVTTKKYLLICIRLNLLFGQARKDHHRSPNRLHMDICLGRLTCSKQ